jgi:hypothetical protein
LKNDGAVETDKDNNMEQLDRITQQPGIMGGKNDKGDVWTKAANYHSRTPKYNETYRTDLIEKAVKWANWLEAHFQSNRNKTPENKVID